VCVGGRSAGEGAECWVSNLERRPGLVTCGGRGDTPGEPVLELLAGREVTLGESTKVRRLLPPWVVDWSAPGASSTTTARTKSRTSPACRSRHTRAHRPADGELAAGRSGPARGHPGQRRHHSARSTGTDDCGARHRATPSSPRRFTRRCCTAPSCGGAAPAVPEHPTGVRTPHRPAGAHRPRLRATVATRRARRRGVRRDCAHPAGRGGPRFGRRPPTSGCRWSRTSSTPCSPRPEPAPCWTALSEPTPALTPALITAVPTPAVAQTVRSRVAPRWPTCGWNRVSCSIWGPGGSELRVRAESAHPVAAAGWEPFEERLVMWWNFVAGDGAEIAEARADWMAGGGSARYPAASHCPPRDARHPTHPRGRTR